MTNSTKTWFTGTDVTNDYPVCFCVENVVSVHFSPRREIGDVIVPETAVVGVDDGHAFNIKPEDGYRLIEFIQLTEVNKVLDSLGEKDLEDWKDFPLADKLNYTSEFAEKLRKEFTEKFPEPQSFYTPEGAARLKEVFAKVFSDSPKTDNPSA